MGVTSRSMSVDPLENLPVPFFRKSQCLALPYRSRGPLLLSAAILFVVISRAAAVAAFNRRMTLTR